MSGTRSIDALAFEWHGDDARAAANANFLEDRLYEFNVAATGIDDGAHLQVLARNEADEIVAGLGGVTWGGTFEVRQLWVAEAWRGSGLGSDLLTRAEAEAGRRGCTQAVLSSYDFQAPGFYARHGYVEWARLDGYPRGHASVLMRKDLPPR